MLVAEINRWIIRVDPRCMERGLDFIELPALRIA